MKMQIEYTDTFGGEANYAWVRRREFEFNDQKSDLALVRQAKALLGLTGIPCLRAEYGDTIELRPRGGCSVAFITPVYI